MFYFYSLPMNTSISNYSENDIIACLKKPQNDQQSEISISFLSKIFSEPPRKAAVLVPLLKKEGEWHILFIHRTEDSKEHSDQVAFPGGRIEFQQESVYQAALRETEEEIGLPGNKIKIIGELNPILTISNYEITPIIGIIPWPYPFTIQTKEVKHYFTIPLNWLADPDHWEIRKRAFSPLKCDLSVIYFKKYNGETLWGVSARIMLNCINQLKK